MKGKRAVLEKMGEGGREEGGKGGRRRARKEGLLLR